MRLRCTVCPWQVTVTGQAAVRTEAHRHIRAHEVDPNSLIVHLPGWLLPWRRSV